MYSDNIKQLTCKVVYLLILSILPNVNAYSIRVKTQHEFETINEKITEAIKAGKKNIKVKISPGVYKFHGSHIKRENEQYSDVAITIEGHDAILTSVANFSDKTGIESCWTELNYADSLITVVDKERKLCFIPYKNEISVAEISNFTKVQVTQWYLTKIYSVAKIDENGIYFEAKLKSFNNPKKGCNYVNADFLYLRKNLVLDYMTQQRNRIAKLPVLYI